MSIFTIFINKFIEYQKGSLKHRVYDKQELEIKQLKSKINTLELKIIDLEYENSVFVL